MTVTLFGKQVAPADLALALAGVLGVLAYVLLLPGAHPDATARYAFDRSEAEQRARDFLEKKGYPVMDFDTDEVELQRDADVLMPLQRELGRRRALRLLRDSSAAWPAYHWRVALEREDEGEDAVFTLSLTQDGTVFSFTHTSFLTARDAPLSEEPDMAAFMQHHLDRPALAAALRRPSEGAPLLAGLSDTLLVRGLTFDLSTTDSLQAATSRQQARASSAGGVPSLRREEAVQMARFHLQKTPLAQTFGDTSALHADSVWTPSRSNGRAAAVRFQTRRHGQTVRADVEVFATGGLRALDTSFNPDADEHDGAMTARDWLGIAGLVLAVLIGIGLLVAFFRRLSERMIDVRAGIIDAVVMGLLVVCLMLFGEATFSSGEAPMLQRLFATVIAVGFIFAFFTLFAFPFTAAADAVGRSAFSGKMLSMSMVRRLAFRNRYVGGALLRGLALAGALLGLGALALAVLPHATASTSDGGLLAGERSSVLAFAAVLSSFVAYGFLLLSLGVASFLERRVGKRAAVVAGVAGVFALLIPFSTAGALSLAPLGYGLLLGAVTGIAFGGALVLYDALTVFTGLFLMGLVGWLDEGWLVAASPTYDDLLMGLLFLALLAAVGFVGVWSGKTGREAEDYTPSYIKELAAQQRLQRDVEIAEEVQRSFLPRRMPRVEGLELAALCLPAREVGGDYYDFIELPGGRLGVVVGDVSGKGIEASFYMTLVKGFLQTLAEEERSPAEVLRRLNALFCRNAPNGTFITMIYGVVDPTAGTFRFARAGHNPLMHRRSRGGKRRMTDGDNAQRDTQRDTQRNAPDQPNNTQTHLLQPRGLAIGLVSGARFDDALDEVTLPLGPGDALVLFTDGFPEARTTGGEEFGEERMRARVERYGDVPAQQLLQTLADDVHTFVEAAGRHDDMTMVVIKRPAGSPTANENGDAAQRAPATGEDRKSRIEDRESATP